MKTQVDEAQELRIQPIDELRAELDLSLPATIDADDGDDPQMDKAADDYVAGCCWRPRRKRQSQQTGETLRRRVHVLVGAARRSPPQRDA